MEQIKNEPGYDCICPIVSIIQDISDIFQYSMSQEMPAKDHDLQTDHYLFRRARNIYHLAEQDEVLSIYFLITVVH
jgi:hypothetical protein